MPILLEKFSFFLYRNETAVSKFSRFFLNEYYKIVSSSFETSGLLTACFECLFSCV